LASALGTIFDRPPVTFTVAPASGTEGDTLSFQISIHDPYYAAFPIT